jgi:hypothetical protein
VECLLIFLGERASVGAIKEREFERVFMELKALVSYFEVKLSLMQTRS